MVDKTPECTLSCVIRDGDVIALVKWEEPLHTTGEHTLPITNMLDDEGDEIAFELWQGGAEPNPLHEAMSVVAGPDAQGKWYHITCTCGFQRMD